MEEEKNLKIIVKNPTVRGFGREYPVDYIKNGKIVYSTVIFGNDIRYANRAFTKEFEKAPIIRKYLERKKSTKKKNQFKKKSMKSGMKPATMSGSDYSGKTRRVR